MRNPEFEQQLNEYMKNLHPISKKLFFPMGECEVGYIARSLTLLIETKKDVGPLLELYAIAKGLMKINNPSFPYATYSSILKRYGSGIERFEIVLLVSFLRFGSTLDFKELSDDDLKWIYKDAYKLVQKFEIIDKNTQGNEMMGAYGRFGYDKTNPIPVCGFLGITEYFEKLRFLNGEKVEYERVGAFSSENIKELIDGYRISGKNQPKTLFFISIYNSRTSDNTPEGFILL